MAINWDNPQPADIFDSEWHESYDKIERRSLSSLKVTKDVHDLLKFLVANQRNILAIKHERAVFEFLLNFGSGQRVYNGDDMMVQMISAHGRYIRNFDTMHALMRIREDTYDRLKQMQVIAARVSDYYGEFSVEVDPWAGNALRLQKFHETLQDYISDAQVEYQFWQERRNSLYQQIKAQAA